MAQKQVFQAETPGRWVRFKWISRVILIVLAAAVVAAAVTVTSKQYPTLPNLNPAPKKLSKEELEQLKRSTKFRAFKLDTEKIGVLRRRLKQHQLKHPNNKDRINAGFYRAWEPQAYTSLVDHIARLDMVVSEGFTVTPNADTITAKIDTGLINLDKKYKKPVLISLTNYINYDATHGGFDTKDIYRIIKSKQLRATFINSVVTQLAKYHFQGVHLELENITDRYDKNFVALEKEFYETLHPLGYIVASSAWPEDDQYDVTKLQHYNDYLFVMAIDEHTDDTNPGDLSNQRWVEEVLDSVCSKIPSEKVILTVEGGGYDWPESSTGKPISYQQAISFAQENRSPITYDRVSANLHYTYYDLDSLEHTVYFTDAATNFNIIRMADDWATGGVALWRLGAEDPRLWSFFQKNLSIDSLRKTGVDIKRLQTVGLNNRIDYAGDGEVLDLVTTPTTGQIDVTMDTVHYTITNQHYIKLPTKYVIRRYGYAPGKIVLTFDDGPDPDYTPRILDILKREHVPAAFFVVGSMAEKNVSILRREYEEGYEIGN
ncbi:MAG: polysaccharide deacetylase family protein, partial [Bacteroidetes bacterium]|nr:polysaccharide deacetylase family protein [Bacteroidota bacterium]